MAEFMIRKMEEKDIEDILEVDRICFTTPWTREVYENELLENNFAHYFVVEMNRRLIAFIGLWIVIDEAQVTNIAVLPDFRRYGIGEYLFGYAIQYLIEIGANVLSLEVRKTNKPAQNLYKKFGFKKGGIRKGYYPDNGEDAYVMWVNLT